MRIAAAEQMRELDRRATEEFGVPSIVLMENAGLRTCDVVRELLDELDGLWVTVICGKGNNGGDGFVVARHLAESGAIVHVLLVGCVEDVKGDAKTNLDIWLKSGFEIEEVDDIGQVRQSLEVCDVVVDAIFGTGFSGEITGIASEIIGEMNASGKPIVSVDLPSGLDSDTGQVAGHCVQASETVTFVLPKVGLVTYPGKEYAGQITVAEIGIPEAAFRASGIKTFVTEESDILYRLPKRPPDGHKGTFGHVALIAGSVGLTGAAAMSGMAAVRIGAGLVTLGVPRSLNDILEIKLTEVMTVPMAETAARSFSPEAVDETLELIGRCDALAIGPGLGRDPETVRFVQTLVSKISRPMVIDADALYALSNDTSIFGKLKAPAVITPHPGEMARLSGTETAEVQSNRLRAARDAAARFGVVVVLKGAATVIAAPDGETWVNSTGSVALAAGGTGDILTGAMVGLLGQGLTALDAAICAVYIHGRAGEIAEEEIGQAGACATDLLPLLPRVLTELTADTDR